MSIWRYFDCCLAPVALDRYATDEGPAAAKAHFVPEALQLWSQRGQTELMLCDVLPTQVWQGDNQIA